MSSKFTKNVIVGVGSQLIIIILGIIVPKIMITNYGSDINGLLGTISQVFTYMALLESGIAQSAKNALFLPISKNDKLGISRVVSAAKQYYRRVTKYYALGVIALAIIAPITIKTEIDSLTVIIIILLEGMSGVVSFFFVQCYTVILATDGKGYINNIINVGNRILSYSVRIILALLGINVIVLQFAFFLITISKALIYKLYFIKTYPWIDFNVCDNSLKLKDKNSFTIAEVAWLIYSSTDMIVLSTFVSTNIASVYSLYNMVFTQLVGILSVVYNSLNYILGQSFHNDIEEYKKIHDSFTSIFMGAITSLMATAYIMIIPFMKLYTRGITDVNYINESIPILFCLIQLISWSRYISGNLTAIAGFAKQTSRVSVVEAIINVSLSIVLVGKYGISGVLIASVLALPIKVIYCTYLADIVILKRKVCQTIRILGINYVLFVIVVIVNRFMTITVENYLSFFVKSVIVLFVISCCVCIGNISMNPNCMEQVKFLLKRKVS